MDKTTRKQGLEFRRKVAGLLDDVPDDYCKRDLNRLLAQLRNRYGLSKEEKKEKIFNSIESGAATVSEIVEETGIDRQQVEICLRELEQVGKIRREKMSISRVGRPANYFFLNYASSASY